MRPERDGTLTGAGLGRVEALRLTYGGARAQDIIAGVLAEFSGRIALVSSFGADAAVLLHMISEIDQGTPVIIVDSLMLFEETLHYQERLTAAFGLRDVRRVSPSAFDLAQGDPDATLHRRNTDHCCDIRKVRPLERALAEWDVVISGRKRFQSHTRAGLEVFETEAARVKVNPLAAWSARELADYMEVNDLPRHPLVAKGYPSIGCAPCTTRVAFGEDSRAGRWRGSAKVECGIHFGADGKVLRAS